MPRLRNANACCSAAREAIEWLNPHFGTVEEWAARPHPLVAYHKVPYLFAIAGRVEECTRALQWIKANLFTPKGDLLSSVREEGKPAQPARIREKSWVALAGHLSGRYDIVGTIATLMAKQQGLRTGGVYDVDAEGNRLASANIRTTACAGMAFLASGRIKEARLAGRFVAKVAECQLDTPRFFLRLDDMGHLVQKFPKTKAERHVLARMRGQTQLSSLSIPMVFLAKLHRVTEEGEWLEAALDYYTIIEQFSEAARTGVDSGAFAWGAALLYGITRRRFYYDTAEKVAQDWIDRQRADGSWHTRSATQPDDIAMTAEGALSLLEAIREAQ